MDTDPSIDGTLHALADRRRRRVVRELAEAPDAEVTVDALEAALGRERQCSRPEMGVQDEIAIQLRHVHLPRLDEVGLCNYDDERECVRYYGDEFAESLLEFIDERADLDRGY